MNTVEQNPFAERARRLLAGRLDREQRRGVFRSLIRLAAELQQRLETDSAHIACAPGCGDCCAINVTILEPEALAIAGYVENHFSQEEKSTLLDRLEMLHRETRWLDDEERMMVRKPCAFLDAQQHCTIHPVRPLLCRSITSTDPQTCREAISMLALGEPPRIICNLLHKNLYHQAYLGLAEALESFDLDHTSYRLTGKVLAELRH